MIRIECQQCDWVGSYADLISEWSGMEPHCPNNCWSTDFIEEDKKMKFKDLVEMSDRIVEKTGNYTSVVIEYDKHPNGSHDLEYRFYQPPKINKFKTVQELKSYMENILSPVADEGIELN